MLDARLANELEFEDRGDDSHATDTAPTTQHNDGKQHHTKCKNKRRVKESSNGYTSTAVEQGKKDKKKKKKKRGEEEVTGNQKKIKKKKKDSVNGREVDKAGRNGSKRRQGAGGQDISPSADVCAVRLFRQVPKGVPCRLDVVNRPGADAHGVARDVPTSVPVRLGTGTHAKGTRGMAPSSSDSDSSDDDKRLLAVVVDAQHIYTSAEHAAKEAAAHISNELIGTYRAVSVGHIGVDMFVFHPKTYNVLATHTHADGVE